MCTIAAATAVVLTSQFIKEEPEKESKEEQKFEAHVTVKKRFI